MINPSQLDVQKDPFSGVKFDIPDSNRVMDGSDVDEG